MQVTPEEIDALYDVQAIDLEISKMERQLEELPQRQLILRLRKKREAIAEKLSQVQALRKDATKKLNRINDEDASLQKKEAGVQAAIEAAGNDFRNAESRTKELDGIFRRRNELSESRESVGAELAKIKALEAQVNAALEELDASEAQATESFKSEGTALRKSIASNKAARAAVLAQVSPDVGRLYSKTSELFDTVFIGKLEGSACSVCRAKIEPGRLIAIMNETPLSTCPSCKRLLIIDEEYWFSACCRTCRGAGAGRGPLHAAKIRDGLYHGFSCSGGWLLGRCRRPFPNSCTRPAASAQQKSLPCGRLFNGLARVC